MGDEKYYTIQVKGEAYRFRPVSSESYERVALVQRMSVDQSKMLQAVTQALSAASVDDAWDKLTDRWVRGDVGTEEATVGLLKTILDRQAADDKKAKKAAAKGPGAASTTLRPADAE